jgi:hypothetical protein
VRRGVGLAVEYYLGETVAVAQVYEDERALVSAAMYPATETNRAARVLCAQLAATDLFVTAPGSFLTTFHCHLLGSVGVVLYVKRDFILSFR